MSIGLLGKKMGMTRIYDENGKSVAVTVVEASDNTVLQRKTTEKNGYSAVQIGYDTQKESRVTRPQLGHFKKHGSTPKRLVKEFRVDDDGELDGELVIGVEQFSAGQFVDVIGKSKGKGFQGVVKRFGFAGQPASHGSKMHRRTGSVGQGSTPGLVWKNTQMPGHTGCRRITVQNLRIVQVRSEDNALLISGAVPGATGDYVVVRHSKKKSQPTESAK